MLVSFLVLLFLWLAIGRNSDPWAIAIGIVSAVVVLLLQRRLFPSISLFPLRLLCRVHYLIHFLLTFCIRFVISTIHTSRLIILGGEEGQIIALPIEIDDPFARFILLNSITLTPSTISLLLEGDLLYIHWLRKKGSAGDWQVIKKSLERSLSSVYMRRTDDRR